VQEDEDDQAQDKMEDEVEDREAEAEDEKEDEDQPDPESWTDVAQDEASIPTVIWVTGKWSMDSPETAAISQNFNDAILVKKQKKQKRREKAAVKQRFASMSPEGTKVYYFTDEDMTKSVAQISPMLENKNVTDASRSALNAYHNLRPGAFRADLWRCMILWAYGGVYLDSNLRLTQKLEKWINFTSDELVLVDDTGAKDPAYWNAMMAVSPRSVYMEYAIRSIVDNVHAHFYGNDPLAVTGPIALFNALEGHPEYREHLRLELKWGGAGSAVVNGYGEIMAVKDEGLHETVRTTYYPIMWNEKHIYCDDPAPVDAPGMCGQ
jgi:mannosyltransferase OCH1-like enzyme